jgi:tetratricopeptide (TPR) repeat protein
MKSTFLSRFTPSLMSPETLEKILVQRHQLAEDLVKLICESALTANKHFQLLVGMRGIGKTHMISLIYHRVADREDLRDELLIAWLREEEWGVGSFLDLLLRIFRALQKEYPAEYETKLNEKVEALYQLAPDEAEHNAAMLLKEFVGGRTLLLLVENLDDLFNGMGEIGQKQLRDYIQNYSFLTILATAQSLFDGIEQKDSPFYGFFQRHDLERLSLDDAVRLLRQIAELDGNTELASFIQTPKGRARVEAIHNLAGGNPRVYVIFSEFLTRKSLDELVEPFMQTLDELTPYYQARMQWLSLQQRKIVEFLVERRQAVPVKVIALRCFITHQTASSQLKKLLEMGYVSSSVQGRESYYELREVLMRFCLEVKKQRRGEPIRLFVDFLRCWYTKPELEDHLKRLSAAEMLQEMFLERECVFEALKEMSHDSLEQESNVSDSSGTLEAKAEDAASLSDEDPHVAAYWEEYWAYYEQNDWLSALSIAEKLVEIRGNAEDWFQQGYCLRKLQRYEEALASFDQAIQFKPDSHQAWGSRGIALKDLGRSEEAIASFNQAIQFQPDDPSAWNNRGLVVEQLGRNQEAITSYDKAIQIKPDLYQAWYNRGNALRQLGRTEEAIASYDKAIQIKPDLYQAWNNRGIALGQLGRNQEAIASYDQAIQIKPDDHQPWNNRGIALRQLGRSEEEIASYDKAIQIKPDYHQAWGNRGIALDNLGRSEEAIASYNKALEFKPDFHEAWYFRGVALDDLGRTEEAIASFDKAIQFKPDDPDAWYNRGIALDDLGRTEEAIASYDKAIQFKPDYHYAWYNRGIALRNLGRSEEAIASYDKAIQFKPDFHQAWCLRGIALGQLGRTQEAIASYDQAIQFQPDYHQAWNNRGNALDDLGRSEEAIASFDKAIEFKPDDPEAWYRRGWALDNLGRTEEALASYDKAIEIDPNDRSAWFSRGWVLNILGRNEEALASCDKAIELGEQSSSVFFNRAIALLGLNRWDEGIAELDKAFNILSQETEKEASADDTELILRNLFNSTKDAAVWKTRITTLIELYDKHQAISALAMGLVREKSIGALMSEMVSDKAAQTWLEVWRELTSDYTQFQIPLRLLNAAVRYRETKDDKRVLLELPIEERNLLKPLLGISPEGQ